MKENNVKQNRLCLKNNVLSNKLFSVKQNDFLLEKTYISFQMQCFAEKKTGLLKIFYMD